MERWGGRLPHAVLQKPRSVRLQQRDSCVCSRCCFFLVLATYRMRRVETSGSCAAVLSSCSHHLAPFYRKHAPVVFALLANTSHHDARHASTSNRPCPQCPAPRGAQLSCAANAFFGCLTVHILIFSVLFSLFLTGPQVITGGPAENILGATS